MHFFERWTVKFKLAFTFDFRFLRGDSCLTCRYPGQDGEFGDFARIDCGRIRLIRRVPGDMAGRSQRPSTAWFSWALDRIGIHASLSPFRGWLRILKLRILRPDGPKNPMPVA